MELDCVSFNGNNYSIVTIPNIFNFNADSVTIGTESLNHALFDVKNGYVNDVAKRIDEQIYAYVDDELFKLNMHSFIEKVKVFLD